MAKHGQQRGVVVGLVLGTTAFTAMLIQQQRIHRRIALTAQRQLQLQLQCKAMADPQLAAVLDTYEEEVPADRQRQFLFANALYGNILHDCRVGTMSLEEALGHLRITCQSKVFREYWDATGHHRASLPSDSAEAAMGRLVDEIVARASDEGDQWWIA
ncbi:MULTISPECIES: DUF6082 family protein [Streptomyces]|uniref:DUF6082 family protein n=1 Tax=Streptomyces cremeus TaxID=66881 RepID=A0ABV5P6J6_STRCM